MVINSKEVLEDLLANDEAAKNEWNATFKLKMILELLKLVVFYVVQA